VTDQEPEKPVPLIVLILFTVLCLAAAFVAAYGWARSGLN